MNKQELRELVNKFNTDVKKGISKSASFALEFGIFKAFRAGSDEFFNVIQELKEIKKDLNLDEEDLELLDTDLGEFAEFEGEQVPLDFPLVEKDLTLMSNPNLEEERSTFIPEVFSSKNNEDMFVTPEDAQDRSFELGGDGAYHIHIEDTSTGKKFYMPFATHKEYMEYKKTKFLLDEKAHHEQDKREYEKAMYQGKEVPLGQPKAGGSKRFYVYVKNSKGNVIKVSFGASVTSALIHDSDRRKAYNARHGCSKGRHNDKTKAGYWSCRLPRFASKVGLGADVSDWW